LALQHKLLFDYSSQKILRGRYYSGFGNKGAQLFVPKITMKNNEAVILT
jgi:hypothetical protein